MAFAVNGVYRHADLTRHDLETHLGSWSAEAGELVRPALERIAEIVETEAPHPAAYAGLRREIGGFVANLLTGEPMGAAAS